jgi:hypothetical protein
VRNYLFTPQYFRFVIPPRTEEENLIYIPYLRFKGNVFYCTEKTIGFRIIDITRLGLPAGGFPMSLGFRPQALKMRFATHDMAGSFTRLRIDAKDILIKAAKLSSLNATGEIFHRSYVGEALSLIYLPLYKKGDRFFDAILNRPVTKLSEKNDFVLEAADPKPPWQLFFIGTLCPQCGWNLEGERDSVVLVCTNCDTAWEPAEGRFVQVGFSSAKAKSENSSYLPFWKLTGAAKGLELDTYADFIRLTNQPIVVGKEMEQIPMHFWVPAFKIRPKIFLRLSKQLTLSQHSLVFEDTLPKKDFHPVTLQKSEAVQGLKTILADSAQSKRAVLPFLPRTRIDVQAARLIYVPFEERAHDLVLRDSEVSINKNTLAFGRHL